MTRAISKAGIVLFAIAVAMLLGGCNSYLARKLVAAPNLDKSTRGVDAPSDVLGSYYVSRQLRIPVGPPDATLSVWICEPFNGVERFELFPKDGQVHAKLFRPPAIQPASAPKGTVFLLPGIEDNKELGPYILYREMLVHAGYRCIQIDLRGHGRSTGQWITYGVVESHDMVQVLDELEKQDLIAGDVGVMAPSYGAAVAIQWAAIDPRIKAIVALEPFSNLKDAAVDAAPLVLGKMRWMFSNKDLMTVLKEAGKLAGFNPYDASPLAAITKTKAPVLLIHSKTDELVPVRHSQQFHDAAPDHTWLLLVDKQSHFSMWWESRDMITGVSRAWLDRYVAHQPPPATAPFKVALPVAEEKSAGVAQKSAQPRNMGSIYGGGINTQ